MGPSTPMSNTTSEMGDPISNQPSGLDALALINEKPDRRVPATTPYLLPEEDVYEHLGFAFSPLKKWAILTSIFVVQLSMNWNAAIYANATKGMVAEFGVSETMVRVGQMLFLVFYAFGCEIWAPWSEELGRKWVLQISLFLVNLWQIPCALAPNFATVLAFRALGGLSSAGGSVTLGMVADMWEPEAHHYAVAYVVLSSVCGSVIAPIAGGFIETHLSWPWVFWISLIFGVVAQIGHWAVPETRTDVLVERRAKELRKSGEDPFAYGPLEWRGTFRERTSLKETAKITWRPFKFLFTEPIVAFLSLLSGFSDALIFTGLDAFPLILSKWDFSVIAVGLSFIALLVGYLVAYGSFLPVYKRDIEQLKTKPETFKPERRLWWLCYLVPCEPIGLIIMGACALGPPIHWFGVLFGAFLVGIANFAIYMATIDYMVAAYGPFAASATGGNGFCRDLLAGIAAMYARPLYQNIKVGTKWQLPIPSWILAGIAVLLCIPVYIFYIWGHLFRARSPYASQLEVERQEKRPRRAQAIRESREGTPSQSRSASRPASRVASRAASPERQEMRVRIAGSA